VVWTHHEYISVSFVFYVHLYQCLIYCCHYPTTCPQGTIATTYTPCPLLTRSTHRIQPTLTASMHIIIGVGQLELSTRMLLADFGSKYIQAQVGYRESWVMIGMPPKFGGKERALAPCVRWSLLVEVCLDVHAHSTLTPRVLLLVLVCLSHPLRHVKRPFVYSIHMVFPQSLNIFLHLPLFSPFS